VSVDFTSTEDVTTVLDTTLNLIRRGIPLRWGLVPQTSTREALEQAKVVYHLQEAYGVPAMEVYLQAVRVILPPCMSKANELHSH
jgi:UDP-glucose:glycoprotein glucosyltransferase